MQKERRCKDCGTLGLTLDKNGLCHRCWQDRKDKSEEGKRQDLLWKQAREQYDTP